MFKTSLKIVVATVLLLGLPSVAVSQFQSPLLDSRQKISKPTLPKLKRKIDLQTDLGPRQVSTIVPPSFEQQRIPINIATPPRDQIVNESVVQPGFERQPIPINIVTPPRDQIVNEWVLPPRFEQQPITPAPIEMDPPDHQKVPDWWPGGQGPGNQGTPVPPPGTGYPTPPGGILGPGPSPPGGLGGNPAPGPVGDPGNPGVDPAPYMNLPLDQAILKAMLNNKPYRISRINQHGFPMTMDLQPNRLTFQVDNGVVTNATAG